MNKIALLLLPALLFAGCFDVSAKYPLIVLPHGGVHSDFTTC